jgi:DNA polymerase IV
MAYSRGTARDGVAYKQVAYVYVPYFGARIAHQADSALNEGSLRGRPLVLLDEAGHVLATDARASAVGVAPGQTERQAVARCPRALLQPASRYPIDEAQAELSERLARYAGRWQPAGLGAAYLDITGLPGSLVEWCQDLAGDVHRLGLSPSIGLTSGKFSASAAGQSAGPSHVLMLDPVTQPAFLSRQTAALLPLEADILLQLGYLGIRTLGQYARLPTAAVLTRWGQAGRTAQRWAQGYDDRPVVSPSECSEVSAHIEFDGVLLDRDILLAALVRKASKLLTPLRDQLQAIGRLKLVITRGDRRTVSVKHIFPMPTATESSIKLALDRVLGRVEWNGEGASDVSLTLGDITDAPAQQLSLFDTPTPRETLTATLESLAARYGPDSFCMAVLTEPDHPLPERRVSWQKFE